MLEGIEVFDLEIVPIKSCHNFQIAYFALVDEHISPTDT
jgi:hypothetical protein